MLRDDGVLEEEISESHVTLTHLILPCLLAAFFLFDHSSFATLSTLPKLYRKADQKEWCAYRAYIIS